MWWQPGFAPNLDRSLSCDRMSMGSCPQHHYRLFSSITTNKDLVLASQLLPKKATGHDLRPRAHGYTLPKQINILTDKNCISRMLFKFNNMY